MKTLYFPTLALAMLMVASLFLAASAEAQKQPAPGPQKVYKWVDENGEVHFSETLPPDFQDKKHDVLDRQGITRAKDQSLVPPPPANQQPKKGELPRDKSGLPRPEPIYTEAELKAQQDSLLLLRYDSDQEIIDAMEVEIHQLAYDRRLLETSRDSLTDAYQGHVREAAERQRAGLAVEPKLIKDIQNMKSRLASNAAELAGLQQREDSIRQTFGEELEHYRTLVAEYAEKEE